MSLINDALKRVSEAERGQSTKQLDIAMRTMEPVAQERRRSSAIIWISVAALSIALVVGAFVVLQMKRISATPANQPIAVAQPPVAPKPAQAPQQVRFVEPQPEPAAPAKPALEQSEAKPPIDAAPVAPQPTPTPAPAVQPASPAFRLKGILYNSKHPIALINNASVSIGGEVNGATVTKIDAATVTIEFEGKPKVLKLGSSE